MFFLALLVELMVFDKITQFFIYIFSMALALLNALSPAFFTLHKGWALAGLCGTQIFLLGSRKSQIFHTDHILGTHDDTASEHWAKSSFFHKVREVPDKADKGSSCACYLCKLRFIPV